MSNFEVVFISTFSTHHHPLAGAAAYQLIVRHAILESENRCRKSALPELGWIRKKVWRKSAELPRGVR